jgi:hypothetical protein
MRGEKEMSNRDLKRRDFLIGSTALMASLAAAGTTGIVMAPDGAWAMSTEALNSAEAAQLIKLARAIYPHPQFDDALYANVIHGLDTKAAADPTLKTELQDGLTRLQTDDFDKLDRTQQIAVMEKMETTPFFQTVRSECITSIYNNPDVWKALGYQGSSAEYGGYIHRGFDDINWPNEA